MLGRKPTPVIGILTGSSVSGSRSPKTNINTKAQSPKGPIFFDHGGVGLGIVVALDRRTEFPALFTRNLCRPNPIPVISQRNRGGSEEMKMESTQECSIMTSHDPNKSENRNPYRIESGGGVKSKRPSVFHISPVRILEPGAGVPPPDFLSSCNLCRRRLHDKDIYMYKGEKAFCSEECRYEEIVRDERKEKCSSESSVRAVEVASPPRANAQIKMCATGILAI